MASGERILESIEEEMAGHGTPQAITITIVEPSAWRPEPAGLHTTTYDSTALVTSVQAQDAVGQDTSTLVVVPGEGGGHRRRINVSHGAKGSIQTVSADGHITTQELPIISSVCSNEDETSQHSTIQVSNKTEPSDSHGLLSVEGEVIEESEEIDDSEDTIGHHCLVCNVELPIHANDEAVPLFKTDTTATQRKMAVYLGILVGRKLTSGRVHSDTICRRCFSLLDRVDSLEVEIKETKEEIVNKYLDTQAAYGGRAQRRKTVAPKQSDYVYPKVVEPEDEVDEVLKLEMDENFEPSMDDLIEEEQDQQEDHNTQDEEWEPEFRRPRVKREAPDLDPSGQPKRKRGRPRKDASRPKEETAHHKQGAKGGEKESDNDRKEMGRQPQISRCSQEVYNTTRSKRRTRAGNFRRPAVISEPFVCSECGDIFNSEPLYKIHCTEAHAESDLIRCPHCPLRFDRRHDLDSHLINHSSVNNVCEMCGIGFSIVTLLVKHLKEVHPDTANICLHCNAVFITADQLAYHVAQKHKRGRRRRLNSTKEDNVSSNGVICTECGKMCNNTIALQSHKYNEHIHLFPNECAICCRRFSKESVLESHLRTHIDGSYECLKCGVKFGHESHLVDHMFYLHGQKKALMCDMCSKHFSNTASLKIHKEMEHREHMDCKEVCEVCGDKYPNKMALKRHMLVHNRRNQCRYCGKKLGCNASLQQHINMVHTKEQSFLCPYCNKEFYAKQFVQMHIMRVHSDRSDFKYKCGVCGKVYLQKWELVLHNKTHTNERNYKCDICGDAFYTLSRMRYHKATHKLTRDSVCPVCAQMFRRDVDTKNHLRRVHKVLHPGHFMEVCGRIGLEKAKKMDLEIKLDETEEEQKTEKVATVTDEGGSAQITLYRVKGTQEHPVQVIILDGVEMMGLQDSIESL